MSARPGFFVICADGDIPSHAVGPFDTRADAVAEDEILQREWATRCPHAHRVVRRGDVPRTIEVRPPQSTPTQRVQQQARSAAMRAAR